jgi:clan AA aspartic protease
MGKTMTPIRLTNTTDRENVHRGLAAPEAVRRETIEALVDTGATTLALPADVVARLGLAAQGERVVRLADGTKLPVPWVFVAVEIVGRETVCEAVVLPEGATALIGQIPLEGLDLIVDPKSREVRVNPASPDMPLLDLL